MASRPLIRALHRHLQTVNTLQLRCASSISEPSIDIDNQSTTSASSSSFATKDIAEASKTQSSEDPFSNFPGAAPSSSTEAARITSPSNDQAQATPWLRSQEQEPQGVAPTKPPLESSTFSQGQDPHPSDASIPAPELHQLKSPPQQQQQEQQPKQMSPLEKLAVAYTPTETQSILHPPSSIHVPVHQSPPSDRSSARTRSTADPRTISPPKTETKLYAGPWPPEDENEPEELRIFRRHNSSLYGLQGQVIIGKVVATDRNTVLVDTGFKSFARFFRQELVGTQVFESKTGDPSGARFETGRKEGELKVGDRLQLRLDEVESPYGDAYLSTQRLQRELELEQVWREIEEAYTQGKCVMGRLLNPVNQGYAVGVGGYIAFLPLTRCGVKLHRMVGVLHPFTVSSMNRERRTMVLQDAEFVFVKRNKFDMWRY